MDDANPHVIHVTDTDVKPPIPTLEANGTKSLSLTHQPSVRFHESITHPTAAEPSLQDTPQPPLPLDATAVFPSNGSITWTDRNGQIAAATAAMLANAKLAADSDEYLSSGRPSAASGGACPTCGCVAGGGGGNGGRRKSSLNPFKRFSVMNKSHHTIINGVDYTNLKRDFIMRVSRALAMYGAPSHRLEYHLTTISEALGVESVFLVFPGMIMISFGEEDHSSHMHLVKTFQGWNMSKLMDVNTLCHRLCSGEIPIEDALDTLSAIKKRSGYGKLAFFLTFPTMSLGFAILGFGGRWIDALFAGLFGCVVGGASLAAERFPSFTYLCDFASAVFVSFLAKIVDWGLSGECLCLTYITTTLSGLVMLLPGLSLTISIIEISTRNMISGTVRLFTAMFTALLVGFGMSFGHVFAKLLLSKTASATATNTSMFSPLILPPTCSPTSTWCTPISYWLYIPFFFPLTASVCIFLESRLKQWPIMFLVSALGLASSTYLSLLPSLSNTPQIPNVVASFLIGLASNTYARFTGDVAVGPILAGIINIVPGSMGVRSSLGFFENNVVNGTQFAFQMLTIGLSITMGLFVATLVVFPVGGPKMEHMTV
ncbi:hypothetical protein HDV00_002500 [Rhizophlyctis rosea]|nr:hypothetical protein HDV00_002500 [Rhizophlyctis rosea]